MSTLIPQVTYRRRDEATAWSVSPSPVGGSYPITFPTVPLIIKAELELGGEWVDITSGPNGIYYETRIKIKRGRDNEASRAQPSYCKIKLKNPNGYWSPRNPNGPYFGLLNRNVKLRITVNPGDNDYVRFVGYVSKWPQKWTVGDHRWVELEANGILRRLGMGKSPLKTPILRAVLPHSPYAFWTMTESSDDTQMANEVNPANAFSFINDFTLAGFTDSPSGVNSPAVKEGYASANVTSPAGTCTGWVVGFGMKVIGVAVDDEMNKPLMRITSEGQYTQWDLLPAVSDGGALQAVWTFRDPFSISEPTINAMPNYSTEDVYNSLYDDQWHYYQLVTQLVGVNLTTYAYYDGDFQGGVTVPISSSHGHVINIELNPELRNWTDFNLSFSNLSVYEYADTPALTTSTTIDTAASAFFAHIGETPTARFARLCTEEGIPYIVSELVSDTETMGPQGVDTLLNLLRECEAVNEGVMDEALTGELRLLSRTVTWNQPATMVIDYTSGAVKEGFLPTDDDLLVRNDWTITRKGGRSRQYVQETGTLNVNDPVDDPQGVFRYDDSATLNVSTDEQAFQHASLRVSRGTVDEMRIASMPLHFSSNPELLAAWLEMDIQKRFQLTNTPQDMGFVTADQILTGYEESIDRLEWTATPSGAPASTEQVGIVDDYGYLDCAACVLAEDLDTTETGIDVAISDICTWVISSGPYYIVVGGEEMLVTAVSAPVGSGSSWTQTLTVTRSTNGVVKTHTSATEVHVRDAFILAL